MNLFIADLQGTGTGRGDCPSITWHGKKAEPEKMTNVQTWENKTLLLGGSWNGGFMHMQRARQIGSKYKASASLKTFFLAEFVCELGMLSDLWGH